MPKVRAAVEGVVEEEREKGDLGLLGLMRSGGWRLVGHGRRLKRNRGMGLRLEKESKKKEWLVAEGPRDEEKRGGVAAVGGCGQERDMGL